MNFPAVRTLTQGSTPIRTRHTEDTWRAIARSVHLAEVELTPVTAAGRPSRAAGTRAAAHLAAGRFLLDRLAERHAAGARTRLGRTWRLHSVRRSVYAKALTEGLAYARAAAQGSTLPPWRPVLFQRAGHLPELERFLPDRLIAATP